MTEHRVVVERRSGRPGQRGSALVRALVWLVVGAAVTLLLVVDPFGVSPVDGWLGVQRMVGVGHGDGGGHGEAHEAGLWTCSMHPQVIEDAPGQCPICGMDLVPLRQNPDEGGTATHAENHPAAGEGGQAGDRKILFYRSPMDPSVTSPVPRKDEMGMDYVPVYADEAETAAAQGAVVAIDPSVQQNMNVVTESVTRRDISHEIRTVGYLDYDQEEMVSITTKYPGFIEETYVNYIGQPVVKGEPLFEIYAPELVQTEQELLSALRYATSLSSAPGETRRRAEALLDAARQRFAYWDISPDQVRRLEETGEVFRTLQVKAPVSGIVMKRMPGLEGMAVRPGMELLHIADLSDLWLTVEIFEDQLPWLNVGSEATVNLTYFPGETFRGRVRYIEPEVSEKTRTVQLTLEVPNPGGKLRVGMYATVVFKPMVVKNALTVPSEAVIRTGRRDLVVVDLGGGRFAPREVTLGPSGNGIVQVLDGLKEGDEIVTSSQFLIDSESNLREAIQKMITEKRAGGGS
jgi:Cu(I)/Ag(I) efflux system membrane fusion protein